MSRLVRDNQYHGKYRYVEDLGYRSLWDIRAPLCCRDAADLPGPPVSSARILQH